ncbi:tetratricopeptide repeat protein [Lysobacter gummosus]|uniref:tetratricopeptide repeat protein n=1 Tax=Lysobacter gummosus TaxID=262324 RepID=UPI003625631E
MNLAVGDTGLQRLLRLHPANAGPAAANPARVLEIDADFARDGTWAGARELAERAYLELLEHGREDLIDAHNAELHMALPLHRERIPLKYACLTDTARDAERTRNFPLDRAYRLVHGLVGLVLDWKQAVAPGEPWLVLVRQYDHAQHLATRLFAELARRAARRGEIAVIIDSALDHAELSRRAPGLQTSPASDELRARPVSPRAGAPGEVEGAALEAELARGGALDWEINAPRLLAYHLSRGESLAAAQVALRALCLCNHYGYYHESASFADTVLPHFDEMVGDDEDARWNYLGNIFQGMVTTDAEVRALRLILDLAEPRLTRRELRAKMHYLLSMIYLRYSKKPDLALAEHYILLAAADIDAARGEIPDADQTFLKVFIDNGLAFLRVRQGRPQDALALCQEGYALLTRELGEDRHTLHRSVLQYNTAQVYVMLDRTEDALVHYRKSIEMDPYYSEYYNESANILQREERFEEALELYESAARYSAPYPEVHFNRGVCHSRLGEWEQALAFFELSLELNPAQPEIHVLRAEIHEELDDAERALADYDAAIALAADSVPARVNRAVMHFGRGSYDLALSDMDHVIAIDGGQAGHYENRAEIHKAMRQDELYRLDLDRAEACRETA